MTELFNRLASIIEDRKKKDLANSYVATLHNKGMDAILKKLGEETTEVVIAAKNQDKQAIIHEMADLWFHSLVLLSAVNLQPEDIISELEERFGISGLKEKEKASRIK